MVAVSTNVSPTPAVATDLIVVVRPNQLPFVVTILTPGEADESRLKSCGECGREKHRPLSPQPRNDYGVSGGPVFVVLIWDRFSLEKNNDTIGEDWHHGTHVHGWSCTPTKDMIFYVLGVTPAEPGYTAARVAPNLGDLEWAEGKVPTPFGLIAVRVEFGQTAAGFASAGGGSTAWKSSRQFTSRKTRNPVATGRNFTS